MKTLKSHYRKTAGRDTMEDLQRYNRYSDLCAVRWIIPSDYSTFLMIEDFVFAEMEMRGITLDYPHESAKPKEYSMEDHLNIKRKEIALEQKLEKAEKEMSRIVADAEMPASSVSLSTVGVSTNSTPKNGPRKIKKTSKEVGNGEVK